MANETYSRPGGYRNDRPGSERDNSRQASSDYRPGDTGYVRGFGDHESTREQGFGGRDSGRRGDERSRSFYGTTEDWAREDQGYERPYGDSERSRAWARESYRANPSSFSYEPGRARSTQSYGDRYGRGSDYHSDYDRSERYHGSDERGRRSFMDRAGDEVASWFGDERAQERRVMDEHRGKGPKGYQRSDARIEEDVNDRLSDDPVLDASNITVAVKEGEVTLSGFVATRWDKRRAEDVTDDVSGVRHVQNNLRVSTSTGNDLTGSTTT
jgi:osmotically-inducible protein OsmY